MSENVPMRNKAVNTKRIEEAMEIVHWFHRAPKEAAETGATSKQAMNIISYLIIQNTNRL